MKPETEFMDNLSSAMLQQTHRGARLINYSIAIMVVVALYWAWNAEIDQLTRGMGKIVPSSKNQIIQNLEGGIVEKIMVKTGAIVEKGQALLKIDNKVFESNLTENQLKIEELQLRKLRLEAEIHGEMASFASEIADKRHDLRDNETRLLRSNLDFLANQINIVKDQISQRNNGIANANIKINHLKQSKVLLVEKIDITRPLVEKGIEARASFISLERELSALDQEIDAAKGTISVYREEITELQKKAEEFRISFKSRAQREMNEAIAEIDKIKSRGTAITDQVQRTLVVAPVRGVVKQIFVNTIGGVVKPGMDLLELVPIEDSLLIEAKISPADIAFIGPDQKATIKVTAYDFSIFGGLKGHVFDISADTMTEPNGMTYYLVRLKTESNTLGTAEKPLRLIPGMMVSVDILTGKRTVLDYLLKPILKAKQVALTER